MTRTVAVLGGGHGGRTSAAELTLLGYEVRLYEDEAFSANMRQIFETREIRITGQAKEGLAKISAVTTDMREAVLGAELVFIAVPAFAHRHICEGLADCIHDGQMVAFLPGTFGTLVLARIMRDKGMKRDVILAEANSLPYDTRIQNPGEVHVFGRNEPLGLGVFPAKRTQEAMDRLSGTYTFRAVADVLDCGLISLNPNVHTPGIILNTGRIERSRGEFWLYEEGITPAVCRVMEAMDRERMNIQRALGYRPLSVAQAIAGDRQARTIWEELNGHPGLTPIKGPVSVKNRYFTEDIPYGLVPWSAFGDLAGVDTPIIDSAICIGSVIIEEDPWATGRTLEDMGIAGMTTDDLRAYLFEGA